MGGVHLERGCHAPCFSTSTGLPDGCTHGPRDVHLRGRVAGLSIWAPQPLSRCHPLACPPRCVTATPSCGSPNVWLRGLALQRSPAPSVALLKCGSSNVCFPPPPLPNPTPWHHSMHAGPQRPQCGLPGAGHHQGAGPGVCSGREDRGRVLQGVLWGPEAPRVHRGGAHETAM